RVSVFGQEGVSNSYLVDAAGYVNLALTGPVAARGLTAASLAQAIAARLREGYIREPHVSVEVEAYRPFYILGEVNAPGQYPYQPGMSVETAIAIAGGYSPRADKRNANLTRSMNGAPIKSKVPLQTPLRPGDTVNVPERWF
ncbi:MAG: polysaccharide biosynthesis/export family protein, partial [Pseudorhodoplanes sp.]